jgi:PleD family two-component response regulator
MLGTVFDVYLPRVERVPAPEIAETAPIPTGKETILFVDDEVRLAEIGKEMLEHLGYKVISKSDSEEALVAFSENPDMFDLVITDQST